MQTQRLLQRPSTHCCCPPARVFTSTGSATCLAHHLECQLQREVSATDRGAPAGLQVAVGVGHAVRERLGKVGAGLVGRLRDLRSGLLHAARLALSGADENHYERVVRASAHSPTVQQSAGALRRARRAAEKQALLHRQASAVRMQSAPASNKLLTCACLAASGS